MFTERGIVSITTSAGGGAEGFTRPLTGKISSIHYVKGGAADDLLSATDISITNETTGDAIWVENSAVSLTRTIAPKISSYGVNGIVALYAASGTGVLTDIVLTDDRVKIAATSGGNAKSGTFHVVVG